MSSALSKTVLITGMQLVSALPVLAAAEGRDNPPEVIVWGFLGLCALIVVAQIVPVIRILKKQSKTAAEQTKPVNIHQL